MSERTGAERARERYRARWLKKILADGPPRPPAGLREGIYGAEACQLCGAVETFFGWAAAMGKHYPWQGTEFVCDGCAGELIPQGICEIGARSDAVWRVLEASNRRYCQLCLTSVSEDPGNRAGRHWLCEPCRHAIVGEGADPALFADELVRWRYRKRDLEAERRLRSILDRG